MSTASRIHLLAIISVLAIPAGALSQSCYGSGDLDGDGVVAVSDLDAFATVMIGPDRPLPPAGDPDLFARADHDGDTDVDLHDFADQMSYVADTYFAYGRHRDNAEAELLAMVLTNSLRAPDAAYDRILRDLDRIRTVYAELATVIDDPDFLPNQLIVGVGSNPPAAYVALNEFYLVVDEDVHSSWRVLTFCDNLNGEVLRDEYAAIPGVNWAEPNYLIGIDDYITIAVLAGDVYRYTIDDGFHDCFDGCDCHRVWVIDVDSDAGVTLVSYDEWGQPWCDFGQ
jgi:hypothetical protein